MTITLSPEVEARLQEAASREGLPAEEYARQLITDHLPAPALANPVPSLMEMFAQWEAADKTDDPDEIARRNQEVEEFKQAMNRNRLEMEGPFSRKFY